MNALATMIETARHYLVSRGCKSIVEATRGSLLDSLVETWELGPGGGEEENITEGRLYL